MQDPLPTSPDTPVALLVDGDNISAAHAAQLIQIASRKGRVTVARVYANLMAATGWQAAPGYRQYHAGIGKNGADLLLSMDAMELALTARIGTFVLASSDGDFTHLALRLRELGHHVEGVGEAKAPAAFRAACLGFTQLQSSTPAAEFTNFDQQIRSMIAEHSQHGRGMRIVDLGAKMRVRHGAQISARPERNWRGYLAKRPHLFQLDPKGPEAMVRFLPEGFDSPS
jgi:uncharacterized LabA/DUF88 family protein